MKELKHVHIVGVCGTLMGAFASYMKRAGARVTGSDQNVYPPMSDVLSQAGVELYSGYTETNLTQFTTPPDLVVIGNVISGKNPEAIEARNGNYKVTSLPEAMEQYFLPLTKNCVVAGTHGKTTTSSLLAYSLDHVGLSPSYFIGGVSVNLPNSFHISSLNKDVPFVLEGDEYDTAFWDKVPKFNHYLPDHVILTSVEFDHADIYADFAAVEKAFFGLMDRIRPSGHCIACTDHGSVRKVIERFSGKKITYGLNSEHAQYTARDLVFSEDVSTFSVFDGSQKIDTLSISLPGAHNVLNALAVYLELREWNVPVEKIKSAFLSFKGVKRRQEIRGELKGVLIIDDFAHHPTAVKETLRALKLRYPKRRLVTVFEPRSATSRRKIFQQDYLDAFKESDLTLIASPYDQSKIPESDQFSSDQLVQGLNDSGKRSYGFSEVEEGVRKLAGECQSGDLVAILSNGGFGGFIPKLMDQLKSSS
jgi:UDP-N-acetylmuramate: L-alanyl-gamma-D-glutamyl-meso-diaminopimelate ligase